MTYYGQRFSNANDQCGLNSYIVITNALNTSYSMKVFFNLYNQVFWSRETYRAVGLKDQFIKTIITVSLSAFYLPGNSCRAHLCCSLHHSQRLHITGSAASSPPSGGGKSQSRARGRGPWLSTKPEPQHILRHRRKRAGWRWNRKNPPAEQLRSDNRQ